MKKILLFIFILPLFVVAQDRGGGRGGISKDLEVKITPKTILKEILQEKFLIVKQKHL